MSGTTINKIKARARTIELFVLLLVIVVVGLVAVPVWRELTAPTPVERTESHSRPELTSPGTPVPARVLQPVAGGAPTAPVPIAPPTAPSAAPPAR